MTSVLIRYSSVVVLFLALVAPVRTEPQISHTITLTTGTAVRLVPNRTLANSILIQVQPGSTNPVYVLWADTGITCNVNTAGQLVATLGPGTASQPGSSFTFPSNGTATTQAGGFDIASYCVQGTSSDTVVATWDQRQ